MNSVFHHRATERHVYAMEYEFSSSPFRKGQIGNVTLRQRLVADPEGVGAVSGQPAYEGPGQQGGPDDSGVYDEGHTVMKKRRNRAKLVRACLSV